MSIVFTRYMLRNCNSLSETWCVAKSTSLKRNDRILPSFINDRFTFSTVDSLSLVHSDDFVWHSVDEDDEQSQTDRKTSLTASSSRRPRSCRASFRSWINRSFKDIISSSKSNVYSNEISFLNRFRSQWNIQRTSAFVSRTVSRVSFKLIWRFAFSDKRAFTS